MRSGDQRTLLRGTWEEPHPHSLRRCVILFHEKVYVGCQGMHHRKYHVGCHDQALPGILDPHADVAKRMAGQVDDGDAARDLALAVNSLQPRI